MEPTTQETTQATEQGAEQPNGELEQLQKENAQLRSRLESLQVRASSRGTDVPVVQIDHSAVRSLEQGMAQMREAHQQKDEEIAKLRAEIDVLKGQAIGGPVKAAPQAAAKPGVAAPAGTTVASPARTEAAPAAVQTTSGGSMTDQNKSTSQPGQGGSTSQPSQPSRSTPSQPTTQPSTTTQPGQGGSGSGAGGSGSGSGSSGGAGGGSGR
jgi:hypothetical protein